MEKDELYADILITGQGGHSSQPFKTINPLPAGAGLIKNLLEQFWYGFDCFERPGLEVLSFDAGERGNVIPQTGNIRLRFFSCAGKRQDIEKKLGAAAASAEALWGVKCSVSLQDERG